MINRGYLGNRVPTVVPTGVPSNPHTPGVAATLGAAPRPPDEANSSICGIGWCCWVDNQVVPSLGGGAIFLNADFFLFNEPVHGALKCGFAGALASR